MKRREFIAGVSTAGVFAGAGTVGAQATYPSGAVRIVVPFPPGGGTDILSRHLARYLTDAVPGTFVVENMPGAGGAIGATAVARARADGQTLMMTTAGISAMNQFLYRRLTYNPERDFAPVSRIASTVFAVVANPQLQASTIAELIDLAKRQPGRLNYGSAGIGAAGHLPAELFKRMAGVEIEHVPYRGTGPAITDLLGGQISLMFGIAGAVMPHIRAGRLKVLATTGLERSKALPEVPTVAEAGLRGYSADEWWGIVVPTGTPGPIIARINGWMRDHVIASDTNSRMIQEGFEPVHDEPTAFARIIDADRRKWGEVIAAANISLD